MPILSNSQHELFAQALAKGLNASASYVEAGFKPHASNASRLSRNDNVRARVTEIQAHAAEQAGLTVQWVLDGIKENFERAMQHAAVKDHEGNPTGEYKYEGSVANKCLELAGKHLGMFTDKVEHSGTVGIARIERVIVDSPANSNAPGVPAASKAVAV